MTIQGILKRCTKCGIEKPATVEVFGLLIKSPDGLRPRCKQCRNQDDNQRYHKDPSSQRRASQKWEAKNPEKKRAKFQKWYQNHIDQEHDRGKQYRQSNAAKLNVKNQRRHSSKRKLLATYTSHDWGVCLDYWNYRCAVCGKQQGFWHTLAQAHVIPITKRGTYTPDNIIPLCHGIDGCNNHQSNKDMEQWLKEKYGKRKAEKILTPINAYIKWIGYRFFPHCAHPLTSTEKEIRRMNILNQGW